MRRKTLIRRRAQIARRKAAHLDQLGLTACPRRGA